MEIAGATTLLVEPALDDGRRAATEARPTPGSGRLRNTAPVVEARRVRTATGCPGRGVARKAEVAAPPRKAVDVHAAGVVPVQKTSELRVAPVCLVRDRGLLVPPAAAISLREIATASAVATEGVRAYTRALKPRADGAREIAAARIQAACARPNVAPTSLLA